MVEEVVDIVIVALLLTAIYCFWLVLCHTIYMDYCRSCCAQHISENSNERTQAIFNETEKAWVRSRRSTL